MTGQPHISEFSVSTDWDSALIDTIGANNHTLELPNLTIHLARRFGFCYGVRRAVELAYEAKRSHPTAPLSLTAEIIHNPQVNNRLREIGIHIPDKSDIVPPAHGVGDVVIIPAFGLPAPAEAQLRATGATVIDTTCGSVKQVWRRVECLAADGFTAVIHGNPKHEETAATASRAAAAGGQWLVVQNAKSAQVLARTIVSAEPLPTVDFPPETRSTGFDHTVHLKRIGMANQTTMLRRESAVVAQIVGDAIARREATTQPPHECFRNFDTICNATQERQDAVRELAALAPQLVLIIGGFNSSNTTHLAQLAAQFAPTRHIEDANDLISKTQIRHLPTDAKTPIVGEMIFPQRIAITAGASTPNKTVEQVIHRLRQLCQ